jgi:hypothetical protein
VAQPQESILATQCHAATLYFDGVLSLRDPADKRLGDPFDRFTDG